MAKQMRMPNKKVLLAIAAGAAVVSILVTSQGAIAKQLNAWHLLPQPEPYTALYYNDPQKLPVRVVPNELATAPATLQNMQFEPTHYTYKIVASGMGNGAEQVLKEGSCYLEHMASCAIADAIPVPALSPRVQIRTIVDYVGRTHDETTPRAHSQSLHYWVDIDLPVRNTP